MAMTCITGARECSGCTMCQRDYEPPTCPVCGKEMETLYSDIYGEIVGCDRCIRAVDAWEWEVA